MAVTVTEAVAAYREHMGSMGHAASYVRTQGEYLARFAASCEDIGLHRVGPQHVSKFFQSLPATAASHNRALSALRSFFKFCERMRYLRSGAAEWMLGDRKARKFTRQPKYYIPVSQFGPMLAAAGRRHPVDRITLALAFYTLGRQGEIAGLRLKDLNLTERTLRIYRPKRKRWTTVQICPELWAELDRWLRLYGHELGFMSYLDLLRSHPDWHLAPSLNCIRGRTNGPYDAKKTTYQLNPAKRADRLEKLVKRLLDEFGAMTENGRKVRHLGEGMHTIRRSGARAMIDYLATVWGEDKALLMVSTMLDHETTTMTLLYIGRNLEQKRLNSYLADHSMYGDHGRADSLGENVTRMPLHGHQSNAQGRRAEAGSPVRVGEVDAL